MGVLVLALVVPAAPAVVNLVETERAFAPEGHPRWLGDRFLVSEVDGVRAADDASGVGSVVATLVAWRGGVPSEPVVGARPDADAASVEAEVAVALGGLGFHGTWERPGRPGLGGLAVPFVAIVDADGSATPVIVRRVISGHVYAFDPRVGGVLYRPADWTRTWSGRAFVFDEAPASPGPWR